MIRYQLPTAEESVAVLKARLGPMGKGIRWATVRSSVGGLSHAELVNAAEAAAKRSLLAEELRVTAAAMVETLGERSDSHGG